MKLLNVITGFSLVLWLLNCGSAKTEGEIQKELEAYNETKTMVLSKQFKFEASVSYPFQTPTVMNASNKILRYTGDNAGRIRLNPGYIIKVVNDSSSANLPYVGEIRAATYSNSKDSNITFDAAIKDFKLKENEKTKKLTIDYQVMSKAESFDITMDIFPNRNASVLISGTRRSQIRYEGTIKPLDD